jgi:signal transduction histidine kinase
MDGLRMIESTGQGLIEFIEEYRRLSLLPPPKKKSLRVKDSVEGILLFFDEEAKRENIQLSLVLEDPATVILADPHQFEMILLNLLRNSLESFSDTQQEKAVSIRVLEQQARVHILVEDNGTGIDEELMDQVFVPFFSTKEDGSGIGLSLVRQVMNNHEGSIHLESVPGKRTLIRLVF